MIIRTDQQSLKYIQEQRLTEGVQHKLLVKLLGYNYKVEYKKERENRAADALSRVKYDDKLLAVTTATPIWITEVIASYENDERCKDLMTQLSINANAQPQYSMKHGILRYKGKLYVGSHTVLKKQLLVSFHSSALGGHSGERATYQRLKLLFYWPKMKQEVEDFVKNCAVCQKNKSEHVPYPGLLQPIPIPDMAWTHISMDFIEGLPKSEDKEVILVVVDRFTKYSHFIAMSHPFTVQHVVKMFIDNVFKHHGLPSVVITDRDRIFTSNLWQDLFNTLGVKLRLSTSYHPETDGQTERVNQCLESYLRCMVFANPKKWCSWLSTAEWWYNTSFHTALRMTPFQALYGFPPPQISEVILPDSQNEEVKGLLQRRQLAMQVIKDNLSKAQNKMKTYADKRRKEREFQVGDMVYLKIQPYRHTSLSIHRSLKLHSKFYGPFRVLERVGKVAYKILLAEGCQLHPTFHVSQLKKHKGDKAVPNCELPLIDQDGNIKVAPVAVLERRVIPRNNQPVVQWLIHWMNLPISAATWEDADFIQRIFPSFVP